MTEARDTVWVEWSWMEAARVPIMPSPGGSVEARAVRMETWAGCKHGLLGLFQYAGRVGKVAARKQWECIGLTWAQPEPVYGVAAAKLAVRITRRKLCGTIISKT